MKEQPVIVNRYILEAKKLRLKRSYSQNFLIDGPTLERIVGTMELEPTDQVVEIGPGAGFLTELLAPKVEHLTAVELDPDMIRYLKRKFAETPNFTLVHQDILKFDFEALPAPTFKVIGNLPYNITSPILFRLAGELAVSDYPLRTRIKQASLMVQKEVGERITASPGCKAYNPLSIAVQFWFEATMDFVIPSKCFLPAPKVDSAIVKLVPRSEPLMKVHDLALMHRLIKAAFSQRRKTLKNALMGASFAPVERLQQAFEQAGIDPGLRPEAISIESFGTLANVFAENPG